MNVPSGLIEDVPECVLERLDGAERIILEMALECAFLRGRLSLSADVLEEHPSVRIHDDFGPVRYFAAPAYSDK
jgi:hypothetical protein